MLPKVYSKYIALQKKRTLLVKSGRVKRRPFRRLVKKFRLRFEGVLDPVTPEMTALCLGARCGEEVQALRELGYDAMGVDLVPFPPLVVEGDFHSLPFETSSFDLIFSNSVDHVFDMKMFTGEVDRMLVRGGHVLLHLLIGNWSDKTDRAQGSVAEVLKYFLDYTVLKNEVISEYGGGLNHCVLLRKGA